MKILYYLLLDSTIGSTKRIETGDGTIAIDFSGGSYVRR